jgi:hypothetical protein
VNVSRRARGDFFRTAAASERATFSAFVTRDVPLEKTETKKK